MVSIRRLEVSAPSLELRSHVPAAASLIRDERELMSGGDLFDEFGVGEDGLKAVAY